jgi:hypothetical protein
MDVATLTFLLTGLWVTYLLIDFILSGRWWLWNLNSMIPPFMLLLVPVGLLALNLYAAKSLPVFAVLIVTILVIWPRSGFDLPNFLPAYVGSKITAANALSGKQTIRVVSWNTEFWADEVEEDSMIDVLRAAPADVYLLQEMWSKQDLSPLEDLSRLQAAFPGYQLHQAGEHVTLSRLPVISFQPHDQSGFTRLDVEIGGVQNAEHSQTNGTDHPGHVVSIYNVHIPVHMIPANLKRGMYFFDDVRSRFAWRRSSLAAFQAELAANLTPKVLSGDYNTSANMPEINWFRKRFSDAFSQIHGGYPSTYAFGPFKLWRIDWVFGEKVEFVQYHQQEHSELSDHDLMSFEFRIR